MYCFALFEVVGIGNLLIVTAWWREFVKNTLTQIHSR